MELQFKFVETKSAIFEALGNDDLAQCFKLLNRFLTQNRHLNPKYEYAIPVLERRKTLAIQDRKSKKISDNTYKIHIQKIIIEFLDLIDKISLEVSSLSKNETILPETPPIEINLEEDWAIIKSFKWDKSPNFVIENFENFLSYWKPKSATISKFEFELDDYGNELEVEVFSSICWRSGIVIVDEVSIEKEDEGERKGLFWVEALVTLNESKNFITVKIKGEYGHQVLLDRILNWWKQCEKQYVEIQNQEEPFRVENKLHVNTIPRKVKIFLASSSELEEDRRGFENFIYRECKRLSNENIFLHLDLWEDFIDHMSKDGLQSQYNLAVRESDIFISLFFTKVGKYTTEEFEVAFKQFKETDKPYIYTYFKSEQVNFSDINKKDFDSLERFKKKLNKLKHFYSEYRSMDDLKNKFRMQLDKILPTI